MKLYGQRVRSDGIVLLAGLGPLVEKSLRCDNRSKHLRRGQAEVETNQENNCFSLLLEQL